MEKERVIRTLGYIGNLAGPELRLAGHFVDDGVSNGSPNVDGIARFEVALQGFDHLEAAANIGERCGRAGIQRGVGDLVDRFVLVARYDDVLGILHQGVGGHMDKPVFVRDGAPNNSGLTRIPITTAKTTRTNHATNQDPICRLRTSRIPCTLNRGRVGDVFGRPSQSRWTAYCLLTPKQTSAISVTLACSMTVGST